MSWMLFQQVLQGTESAHRAHAQRRAAPRFQWMTVTVDACHAHLVRRAVAACAQAVIERCAPQKDHRVRLLIRFDAGHAADVMHEVLRSVPSGEVGCVVSGMPQSTASFFSSSLVPH
ncbi:hypothetical protein [Variovorax sp. HJSM1_2]|uniref:hypothetical protein n=1 Tax=Variovorax sp. HJSM1_2 TaxID=3366263 RepID=UPI003BF47817